MKTKGLFWVVFTVLIFLYGKVYANIVIPALYTPLHGIGVGTRAIGMGGSFVSVSGSPSAVWWNPAGLSQIERMSVYGEMGYIYEEGEIKYDYSCSGTSLMPRGVILTLPSRYAVFAVGVIRPYMLSKEADEFMWKDKRIRPMEKGSLTRAIFSVASRENDVSNLGITFGYQQLSTNSESFSDWGYDDRESINWRTEEFKGEGFSATAGGIWRIGGKSNIGIAIGTQTHLQGKEEYRNYHYYSRGDTVYEDTTYTGEREREYALPKFLRIGASLENETEALIAVQIDFLYGGYGYYGGESFLGADRTYLSAGVEYPVRENITLRMGVYSSPRSGYYGGDVLTLTSGFTIKWRDLHLGGLIENMIGGNEKVLMSSLSVLYEI